MSHTVPPHAIGCDDVGQDREVPHSWRCMGFVGRCFSGVRERERHGYRGGMGIIPTQFSLFRRNPKPKTTNRSAGPHDHSRTVRITRLVEIRGEGFAPARPPHCRRTCHRKLRCRTTPTAGVPATSFQRRWVPSRRPRTGRPRLVVLFGELPTSPRSLSLDDLAEHDVLAVEPGIGATVRKS
jgi:hypothetical protein